MSRTMFRLALALLAVAALQSVALAWMVYDRAVLLREGREIVVDTVPVDPRSLFRGDYVILRYSFSRLNQNELGSRESFAKNDPIYVVLETSAEGGWRAVGAHRRNPAASGQNRIVLRGRSLNGSAPRGLLNVRYGVEAYFVPEGEGRRLENLAGSAKLKVMLAVGRDGKAAIKGLIINGKRVYDEPLL